MKEIFEFSTPGAEGVPASAVLTWLKKLNSFTSVNAFQLMRHGRILARGAWKPYTVDTPHQLFSLSKSFTSCAVGIAAGEGLISLSDPIAGYFPDKLPRKPDPRFLKMTVRDLLTMQTGHDRCSLDYIFPTGTLDWQAAFFRTPLAHEPGTYFAYNSGATYMLSALIRRATHCGLLEYLRERLLLPLGIEHFEWDRDRDGTEVGGWGYSLSVREIANFAEMLRNHGLWQGRQLVPADYLAAATRRQSDNSRNGHIDWKSGYGYQFWMTRCGSFRGDGALGQYALVLEKFDATLAVTGGMANMGQILDATFELLVPEFRDGKLPPEPAAEAELSAFLDHLEIPLQTGDFSSPRAASLNGAVFEFDRNPAQLRRVRCEFPSGRVELHCDFENHSEVISGGYGRTLEQFHRFERAVPRRSAASAAWLSPDTLAVKVVEYETPFQETYTLAFTEKDVTLSRTAQVYFWDRELRPMHGRRG